MQSFFFFLKKTSEDESQELNEMRRRVRFLEDEVKRKQEQAEKPYEQAKTEKSKVNKLFIIFLFNEKKLVTKDAGCSTKSQIKKTLAAVCHSQRYP